MSCPNVLSTLFVKPTARALALQYLMLTIAITGSFVPLATAQPISWAKAVWPEPPFTPAKNPYARRLVNEHFEIVRRLPKVQPEVLTLFYRLVPRQEIATGTQPFAETDVSDGLPRRFDFAGSTSNLWFILYEVGGRAYHHSILIFWWDGKRWQHVAAAVGFVEKSDFPSLVEALKKGRFHVVFDNLNL